jgi:hypothetical protein
VELVLVVDENIGGNDEFFGVHDPLGLAPFSMEIRQYAHRDTIEEEADHYGFEVRGGRVLVGDETAVFQTKGCLVFR